MANYRSIHTKIWSDPWFSDLKSEAQHIFLYLLTNEHRTESGLYPLSIKTIAFETNRTTKEIQTILHELNPKVQYDFDHQVVWVVNAVKHLAYHIKNSEDKRFISVAKDLGYNNSLLVKEFLKVYPQFKQRVSRGSIGGSPDPSLRTKDLGLRTKVQGLRTKEDSEIVDNSVDNFSEQYSGLAILLKTKILENNSKAIVKNSQIDDWANTVRLMVEQDKRTPEEIEELITWSQRDDFWHTNILSMGKLRKQFDQLTLKKKEQEPKQSISSERDPVLKKMDKWARERAERERIEDVMDRQAREKEQAARSRIHEPGTENTADTIDKVLVDAKKHIERQK